MNAGTNMNQKQSELNYDDKSPDATRSPVLRVSPGTNYPLQIRTETTEDYPTGAPEALPRPRSMDEEITRVAPRATEVVYFKSSTGRSISIVYGYARHECQDECGDPWELAGWINLENAQSTNRLNPTGTRWYYYFAHDANGVTWSGTVPAQVLT